MDTRLRQMIDVPPMWLLGFAVLIWLVGRVMPFETGSALLRGVGTALVVLGVAIILVAAWQFWQHKTTIVPHQTASTLISNGLYARSRNPIYLADAIILAGLCLRWDVLPGLILVPVFAQVIQRRFIHGEEARLLDAFGPDFEAYCARVRRWI